MSDKRLFMRLAAVHKLDCAMVFDGPEPELVLNPEELARTLGSDELGRYAEACKPVYEDLRRIVGQLAGLSILSRLTQSKDVADLKELDNCRERWARTADRLGALSTPTGADRHRRQLDASHHFSGLALRTFSEAVSGSADSDANDRLDLLIKRAYAHLAAASVDRAGLQMVDFANACCSCMQR